MTGFQLLVALPDGYVPYRDIRDFNLALAGSGKECNAYTGNNYIYLFHIAPPLLFDYAADGKTGRSDGSRNYGVAMVIVTDIPGTICPFLLFSKR